VKSKISCIYNPWNSQFKYLSTRVKTTGDLCES